MIYSIKEVSKLTGISAHTIRYYEKEGILPPIDRTENGVRVFSDENLFWLDLVICLKKTNMSIKDIKKIISLSLVGDSTVDERKDILINHKKEILSQIEVLKESVNKIDKKIAFYDGSPLC